MGIRTGRQYLDSLRDDRQMWIDGECVKDVTQDRRFAAAAHTMAELYDMQHDPALRDTLTYPSPTSGERVGLSFIQPKSIDDLIRRRDHGEDLDGRDLRHVRPQPGFHEHHADRLRLRGRRPSACATRSSPTTSGTTICIAARTTSR